MKVQTASANDRVLISQNDPETSQLLSVCLRREGFSCVLAQDVGETLELAAKNRLCLIVLDVPGDPVEWDICRRVRDVSSVPILMVSERGEACDIVKGLTLGADDYVVKPFRSAELIARSKALVRRASMRPTMQSLSHGLLTVDLSRRTVTRSGRRIPLTFSEFRILEVLMSAPGRVFSRRELLTYLYASGGVVIERVIDVHVQKLRAKIEDDRSRPRYVLTARGEGYRFAEPADFSDMSQAATAAAQSAAQVTLAPSA